MPFAPFPGLWLNAVFGHSTKRARVGQCEWSELDGKTTVQLSQIACDEKELKVALADKDRSAWTLEHAELDQSAVRERLCY